MTKSEKTAGLAALRGRLDAIDGKMLDLLAERMSVVGEIAAVKRAEGIRIRDLVRERQVLEDRRRRATDLGLPPGSVESIFRLLLLLSRDRQATLGVEALSEAGSRTVAVIGGKGGMGSLFARLFEELGHTVWIADRDTELSAEAAASKADVVVVSVPIEVTTEVIRRVGPRVRDDAVLFDLTSIKAEPMAAMLNSTRASVIGAHPMFGPRIHTLQGQRVVLCPGRGDDWLAWLEGTLRARGILVTRATAEEHDRAMAVVQVLNHFQTEVLGLAMSRLGMTISEALRFTSPAYLLEAYVTARHFGQDPGLYGAIEMRNPETSRITGAFVEAAEELAQIVVEKDTARFESTFDEVRRFFGSFATEAEEQSSFLIDRLVELMAGRTPE